MFESEKYADSTDTEQKPVKKNSFSQVEMLAEKGQEIAGYKLQVRIPLAVDENTIHGLGAKRLGTVHHEDKYFIRRDESMGDAHELIRLRKEGGKDILFRYQGAVANEGERISLENSEIVSRPQVVQIKKRYRQIVTVDKTRTIFMLNSIVLNIDEVLNLGSFVELAATDEGHADQVDSIIQQLGLNKGESTRSSYFELVLKKQKGWQKTLSVIHDHCGKFSFGICSGVLTTLGMVVGLNAATSSRVAVVAGIVAVAVADSLSDSMGIYTSLKIEGGMTGRGAFMAALNTFIGKFIFTLSFILPFILLSFPHAIIASIIWGAALLALVSIQIAYVEESSIPKTILQNEIIAASIIFVSIIAGKCVSLLGAS